MNKIYLVDPYRMKHLGPKIIRSLCRDPRARVVLFGFHAIVNDWMEEIRYPDQVRAVSPAIYAKGGIRITLVAEAFRMIAEHGDDQWTVIGQHRCYRELVEQLKLSGIDVELMPTVTLEEAATMSQHQVSTTQALRELFLDMMRNTREPSVHIGSFANRAVVRCPELIKRANRSKLFGTSKFAEIAKAIGLRVIDGRLTELI